VGDITLPDALEALKPEHAFDLVVSLTGDFGVHYLGTSDGRELECKHGDTVGSLLELVERYAGDELFVKMDAPNALPGAHVLVGDADLGTWLRDMRVTLPPNLTLVYAVYGTPDRSADVTDSVWKALAAPGRYPVSNEFFGCDPHFGVGKMLSIHYEIDDARVNLEVWEGGYFLVT
jgi:hypothetical protein